jgi:lactate dehydrogenase-like 2-hydroxyacid dehydrogenase
MMAKPRVLVTRRWPEAVEAQLMDQYDADLNMQDRPLSEADFRDALQRYDAVLPTVTDKLSPEVFEVKQPRTKILANYGVGYSHIHEPSAKGLGLTVTNTPDVLSECTADLAMMLLLMVARRAIDGDREVRERRWDGWRPTHLVGTKVSGKTLGIIGYGRIGQEMAKRAHHGFGMDIVVYNRSRVAPEVLGQTRAEQVATIDELLPVSDFVSLHCPGGVANRHLINAERLNLKGTRPPARRDRADRVREHRLRRRDGGAGLGDDQQVRRRLSGPALLWRLRICRHRREPRHRRAPRLFDCGVRQRPAQFRQPGQPGVFQALLKPGDTILGMSLARAAT